MEVLVRVVIVESDVYVIMNYTNKYNMYDEVRGGVLVRVVIAETDM